MSTLVQRSSNVLLSTERDLWHVVDGLDLPLLLIELTHFTIVGATKSFFSEVEFPESDVLGRDVFSLFEPTDRARARKALHALAAGTIDFYRTHRQLAHESSAKSQVSLWVHVIDDGNRHYALVEFCRCENLRVSPLVQYLGNTPYRFAIGVLDANGIITSVSTEVENVIGVAADDLIGQPLLREPGDAFWNRLHEGIPESGPCQVSWPEEALHSREVVGQVHCLLACLSGSDSCCFILYRAQVTPERDRGDRAAQLEASLMRIAQEVRASGIFTGMKGVPDIDRFPQLGSLSARQWEVLTRLIRGERVATMASELFVSPSTVRNNLSAIYAKFGVHSQTQLLDLLSH
jgi:DNA-binding CsgD family transcriptional regulator